jgi:hypothetical protein
VVIAYLGLKKSEQPGDLGQGAAFAGYAPADGDVAVPLYPECARMA